MIGLYLDCTTLIGTYGVSAELILVRLHYCSSGINCVDGWWGGGHSHSQWGESSNMKLSRYLGVVLSAAKLFRISDVQVYRKCDRDFPHTYRTGLPNILQEFIYCY